MQTHKLVQKPPFSVATVKKIGCGFPECDPADNRKTFAQDVEKWVSVGVGAEKVRQKQEKREQGKSQKQKRQPAAKRFAISNQLFLGSSLEVIFESGADNFDVIKRQIVGDEVYGDAGF